MSLVRKRRVVYIGVETEPGDIVKLGILHFIETRLLVEDTILPRSEESGFPLP